MNKWIGGALALAALFVGGLFYGWQGVILALTVIVFWLLLQFSRLMRVMKAAGEKPVGRIDSAVMLNAKLREGMRLVEVIPLTRSLGEKIAAEPETYRWTDAGGVSVELQLADGRLQRWQLLRPAETPSSEA
ncbi:hypothetical protein [Roseateles violae]|uniref:Glycerate kinase n=1 Tax=Roseateles violae TaxID=3058042 RepID=A0ABT8DMR8_9BURK|nr:hypothetical protein [Pelomonas sp. PFR6]MDN3919417.1 hypothetical protein [Pelomonas sp. PFR6]